MRGRGPLVKYRNAIFGTLLHSSFSFVTLGNLESFKKSSSSVIPCISCFGGENLDRPTMANPMTMSRVTAILMTPKEYSFVAAPPLVLQDDFFIFTSSPSMSYSSLFFIVKISLN